MFSSVSTGRHEALILDFNGVLTEGVRESSRAGALPKVSITRLGVPH